MVYTNNFYSSLLGNVLAHLLVSLNSRTLAPNIPLSLLLSSAKGFLELSLFHRECQAQRPVTQCTELWILHHILSCPHRINYSSHCTLLGAITRFHTGGKRGEKRSGGMLSALCLSAMSVTCTCRARAKNEWALAVCVYSVNNCQKDTQWCLRFRNLLPFSF